MSLPIESLKSYFPIFTHRPELVYLDSAATSQKPSSVVQSITNFYEKENANVHRGLYELSSKATQRYEDVRNKVGSLIGANSTNIAFTKGTTESINIVAQCYLKKNLKAGDKVLISAMEHHANLIPWQQVCKQTGASLEIIPVNDQGELVLDGLKSLLAERTKLVAITHISNVLGTINPVEEIISAAHKINIPVLIDGAQSVGHMPVDVKKMDVDFLVFSSHKMFGPFGTGILYCKEEFTQQLDPFNYGGGSIKNVQFAETEFLDFPHNLEAGTTNIAGIIGLGTAIDFIQQLDLVETFNHERKLSAYFKERASTLAQIQFVGEPKNFNGIVSFLVKNIHPHDVA
ncbi:MAG: cysteine desulfurase, partial [Bacteroidia bacterium]|nr:cysteine desulfurase [Bacteroidia bacterium]